MSLQKKSGIIYEPKYKQFLSDAYTLNPSVASFLCGDTSLFSLEDQQKLFQVSVDQFSDLLSIKSQKNRKIKCNYRTAEKFAEDVFSILMSQKSMTKSSKNIRLWIVFWKVFHGLYKLGYDFVRKEECAEIQSLFTTKFLSSPLPFFISIRKDFGTVTHHRLRKHQFQVEAVNHIQHTKSNKIAIVLGNLKESMFFVHEFVHPLSLITYRSSNEFPFLIMKKQLNQYVFLERTSENLRHVFEYLHRSSEKDWKECRCSDWLIIPEDLCSKKFRLLRRQDFVWKDPSQSGIQHASSRMTSEDTTATEGPKSDPVLSEPPSQAVSNRPRTSYNASLCMYNSSIDVRDSLARTTFPSSWPPTPNPIPTPVELVVST